MPLDADAHRGIVQILHRFDYSVRGAPDNRHPVSRFNHRLLVMAQNFARPDCTVDRVLFLPPEKSHVD